MFVLLGSLECFSASVSSSSLCETVTSHRAASHFRVGGLDESQNLCLIVFTAEFLVLLKLKSKQSQRGICSEIMKLSITEISDNKNTYIIQNKKMPF